MPKGKATKKSTKKATATKKATKTVDRRATENTPCKQGRDYERRLRTVNGEKVWRCVHKSVVPRGTHITELSWQEAKNQKVGQRCRDLVKKDEHGEEIMRARRTYHWTKGGKLKCLTDAGARRSDAFFASNKTGGSRLALNVHPKWHGRQDVNKTVATVSGRSFGKGKGKKAAAAAPSNSSNSRVKLTGTRCPSGYRRDPKDKNMCIRVEA